MAANEDSSHHGTLSSHHGTLSSIKYNPVSDPEAGSRAELSPATIEVVQDRGGSVRSIETSERAESWRPIPSSGKVFTDDVLNFSYLRSKSGILKYVETGFCFCAWICALVWENSLGALKGAIFVQLFVGIAILMSCTMFTLNFVHARNRIVHKYREQWRMVESLSYGGIIIILIICGIVSAVMGTKTDAAAACAFFVLGGAFTFATDIVFILNETQLYK